MSERQEKTTRLQRFVLSLFENHFPIQFPLGDSTAFKSDLAILLIARATPLWSLPAPHGWWIREGERKRDRETEKEAERERGREGDALLSVQTIMRHGGGSCR